MIAIKNVFKNYTCIGAVHHIYSNIYNTQDQSRTNDDQSSSMYYCKALIYPGIFHCTHNSPAHKKCHKMHKWNYLEIKKHFPNSFNFLGLDSHWKYIASYSYFHLPIKRNKSWFVQLKKWRTRFWVLSHTIIYIK